MLREVKYNTKYMLTKKEFYLTLLIVFLINLVHVFLCINESLRLNQFYEEFFTGEYQFILYNVNVNFQTLLIIILPMVCTMVLSDASVIENKLKTTNMIFTRINYRKNVIIRCFLCFIITFLICMIGFLLNYILLKIIYGSGNYITLTQGVGFDLQPIPNFFLDSIRIANPTLFIMLITVCVSILYGVLVSLSYAVSLYIKNKIIVYFTPIIFIVLIDMIFNKLELYSFSITTLLQPFGEFGIYNYLLCLICIIVLISLLVFIKIKKKDVLI